MMSAANRRQIAPAGQAALVIRHRVIQVASNGGPSATREATGTLPDPDQMPQLT
jgi:hypothetical protein